MEELTVTLAQRLKKLRKARELTLPELSAALKEKYDINISRESLSNYEVTAPHHTKYGKNEGMAVKYLHYLADFYGVSTDYLLGRTRVRTTDTEVQAVSNYTGLSSRAIFWLRSLSAEQIEVFNLLLDEASFSLTLHQIVKLKQIAAATQDETITINDSFTMNREFYTNVLKYTIDESLRKAVDIILKGGI